MTPVPQPPELPDHLPAPVVAYIRALEATIAERTAQVTDLTARLNQNSTNSSKPPSSDGPHVKPAPPQPPSGKRRGGQPGHPKAERTLLPPDEIRTLKPSTCRDCARPLIGDDPHPAVHQVHEIPVAKPHVTEYRCHRLACPHCGTTTVAPVPAEAATGYGPRAQAVAALLTGSCRLGKRGTSRLFDDLFGLPLSPAAVCTLQHRTAEALKPVAEEALLYTRGQPANVDETGWKQGRNRAWLWVAVTTLVVAFLIRKTRDRRAYDDLRGGLDGGPHDRPVPGVHAPRHAQASVVLGAPAARFPDHDRPGRFREGNRGGPVGVFGHPVRALVSGPGRDTRAVHISIDLRPRVASPGGRAPAEWGRVRLRQDGRHVW
jgi:transposase